MESSSKAAPLLLQGESEQDGPRASEERKLEIISTFFYCIEDEKWKDICVPFLQTPLFLFAFLYE